ncbi:MAG: tetratricopeptide repeat protein [Planctomycetes bacterium]|nr:tetratricopeptide repeat protein [Planctomycetota bacterium]
MRDVLACVAVALCACRAPEPIASPAQQDLAVATPLETLRESAVASVGRKDWERARADVTAALRIAPDDLGFVQLRAFVAYHTGDFATSIADYERVAQADPTNPDVHHDLGHAYHGAGRLQDALLAQSRCLALDPSHAGAHHAIGNFKHLAGDLIGAIDAYRRAVELAPTDGLHVGYLGWALADRSLLARTPEIWIPDMAMAKEGIELMERAVALGHESARLFSRRAHARFDTGDTQGAVVDSSRAVELEPEELRWRVERAEFRRSDGDVVGAVEDYSVLLERDPGDRTALLRRAACLDSLGEAPRAIADFERALAIEGEPLDARSLGQLGRSRHRTGDLDGAERDLRAAIALDPEYHWPHTLLGETLLARTDFDGAERSFRAALAADGRLRQPRDGIARAMVGRREYREAMKAFDFAARSRLHGDEAPGLASLHAAFEHAREARHEAAIQAMDEVITRDAANSFAYFVRAVLKSEHGDPAGAESDVSLAIALDETVPDAWQLRADLRSAAGRREAADSDTERADALRARR